MNTDVILPAIWFFLLGTAMGSFYNVLVDRLPEGRDVVRTRSACESCGTQLKIGDLIPVFSYLFLGGRCRCCKAKLSPRYFLSEITVGGFFLFAFFRFAENGLISVLIANLVLWSLLFIVGVMDFQTGMIMDLFSFLIGAAGLVFGLIGGRGIWQILLGAAVGAAFFGLLYIGCKVILKREGLGAGDVFLLAAIGVWFPWNQVIICAFLTAYVALVFIVILAVRAKKIGLKTEFPLGPSICIAAFIMSVWGDAIAGWISRLILH